MHSTLQSTPPPLFYAYPFFCFFSTPFIPSTTSLLIESYSLVGLPPTFSSPIATSLRSDQALFVLLARSPKTRFAPFSPVPPTVSLAEGECRLERPISPPASYHRANTPADLVPSSRRLDLASPD
ncbi:hypothetical protein GGG16DRAFT_129380 [Schizophyllum commune]